LVRFLSLNKKILVAFLLLTGVFVLLSPEIKENPRYSFFEKPFASSINLIQSGFGLIFTQGFTTWDIYVDLIGVKEENQRLIEENKRLRSETASLREKAAAYDRLIRLLEVKDTLHVDFAVASIIAKDPTNWFSAVVINKGEEDGIRPNMGVMTEDGVVGRIVKTAPHYSRVLMISDRNSSIGGMMQRTRDEGIVMGGDGKILMLNYIPFDSDVQEGDIVLTSGADGAFPPGIVIGTVSRVKNAKNALFHSIELMPEVSLSKVREVMVLKTPQPPEIELLLKEGAK
jgi:rod shape-determining protein MreC